MMATWPHSTTNIEKEKMFILVTVDKINLDYSQNVIINGRYLS